MRRRRSARGATKKPSRRWPASRAPVMKTAEHKIVANPAAECSKGSPGGLRHWLEGSRAQGRRGAEAGKATNQRGSEEARDGASHLPTGPQRPS